MEFLRKGDYFQGLEVTKISDSFVFFGKKRLSLNSIKNLIESGERIQFKTSPDIEIDWSNKKKVLEYYNNFKRWSFYLSGGCKYKTACVEVKDGLAYYEGLNYLPMGGTHEDYCAKVEKFPKDGWYYAKLFKRGFGYYNTMPSNNYAYVFLTENKEPYTKEEVDRIDYRNNYKFNILEEDIEHIKSLDLRFVNSKELNFIKSYQRQLFQHLLPFRAKNNVFINTWENFANPLSCTKGLLYIDNGYKGHNINKMDYYVMLKYHPTFTREASYYNSVSIDSININALELIALEIEKSIKNFSIIK
jgi:hypothetical protein